MFLLYCCACGAPFGDPNRIVAEIRALEGSGVSSARPAEELDRPPLRGFWRKHYVLGGIGSFALNVKLGMKKRNRELRRIVREQWSLDAASLPPEVVSRDIAVAVTGLYQERASMQELTGEWIIFARHEGQNYYLSLATHDELRDDHGAGLVERIKGCVSEFPLLADQLARAAA
jgi:hypothetical protein